VTAMRRSRVVKRVYRKYFEVEMREVDCWVVERGGRARECDRVRKMFFGDGNALGDA
jgi:hypothetical protein